MRLIRDDEVLVITSHGSKVMTQVEHARLKAGEQAREEMERELIAKGRAAGAKAILLNLTSEQLKAKYLAGKITLEEFEEALEFVLQREMDL